MSSGQYVVYVRLRDRLRFFGIEGIAPTGPKTLSVVVNNVDFCVRVQMQRFISLLKVPNILSGGGLFSASLLLT